MREFRGAWVATVNNINWPSRPGLSTAQQKAELIALLDRAAQLKLNAVLFQVRPACDALYASRTEPWSEYLTGAMGRPPKPFEDPLALAVAEAHRRGLELHAWFNPYRALHSSAKGGVAPGHVSRTRPQLVRRYGQQLWLDPGEPAVREYSLSVVMDVVRRYDIDGVHFDDYFYPYKEKDAAGNELDFPDEASWRKYGLRTGLSRDDWRRENVNTFIRHVYQSIKSAKPWVKFGVSPFGIWRPGYPPQIQGYDAYAKLYADSRQWLAQGWLDYCAPQLYWAIEPKAQSFPVLLEWWRQQNPKGRHIWPGLNSVKVGNSGWKPSEIVGQIALTRQSGRDAGHVHWNIAALKSDRNGLASALERGLYTQPALVPASGWLDRGTPGTPALSVSGSGAAIRVRWSAASKGQPVWLWVLQTKSAGEWKTVILPSGSRSATLSGPRPEVVAVTAIARTGNASPAAVLARWAD
jgi:uncharacterized lipoprotein YddW (UPF0748 family)